MLPLPERPCGFQRGLRQCQFLFSLLTTVHQQRPVDRQDIEFIPSVTDDCTIGLMDHFAGLKFFEAFAHFVDRFVVGTQFANAVI